MEHFICLVGLNHKSAPVEIREKFALSSFCAPETWAMPIQDCLGECLILSTCNRVEILLVGRKGAGPKDIDMGKTLVEYALKQWAACRGQNVDELKSYTYQHYNEDAIRHLFTVASSLDSLVLGEPQILGQLKDAYRKAVQANATSIIINRVLHKAFSVAKRVRTETAVASSAVSISYAAVELAKRIFDNIGEHQAMLIGAGEMAELAARHLIQAGVRHIYVANRTLENGIELAKSIGGEAIAFDSVQEYLVHSDIIISSTGAPNTILHASDIKDVLRKRRFKPMFFIDIAMPRDIAPDVNNLDNVYLYDIDDLKEVVEENMAQRRDEAQRALAIVEEEAQEFSHWMQSLKMQPTIVSMVQRGEHLAREEAAKTIKRLQSMNLSQQQFEAVSDAVSHMAMALTKKLNHDPLVFLKNQSDGEQQRLIRAMFGLDKGQE